ncbi:hypothetical protein GGI42DRAFT_102666 [Trichoderma sp. SZMC 28013]
MRWWMVLVPPSRMWGWLAYANMCLSVLVLLPGSQQHLFSWAPMATFGVLISWGVTGMSLVLIYNQHLLESPRLMILLPLKIWLAFVYALQSPLAESVLLLPICTTAAMILLTATQDHQDHQDRQGRQDRRDLHDDQGCQDFQGPGLPLPVQARH